MFVGLRILTGDKTSKQGVFDVNKKQLKENDSELVDAEARVISIVLDTEDLLSVGLSVLNPTILGTVVNNPFTTYTEFNPQNLCPKLSGDHAVSVSKVLYIGMAPVRRLIEAGDPELAKVDMINELALKESVKTPCKG